MPANFTPRLVDITKALASPGNVNIIGVVVDVMPGVWKSRGSSTCITFTIKDSNLENGHTWDGLKVKYFRDNEDSLPPVKVHDVILLRNLWVRDRFMALSPQAIDTHNPRCRSGHYKAELWEWPRRIGTSHGPFSVRT